MSEPEVEFLKEVQSPADANIEYVKNPSRVAIADTLELTTTLKTASLSSMAWTLSERLTMQR
jgi:hypothetical protein